MLFNYSKFLLIKRKKKHPNRTSIKKKENYTFTRDKNLGYPFMAIKFGLIHLNSQYLNVKFFKQ